MTGVPDQEGVAVFVSTTIPFTYMVFVVLERTNAICAHVPGVNTIFVDVYVGN
jgi:hypothetical protein